jgi:hypothetical protein
VPSALFTGYEVAMSALEYILPVPCVTDFALISFLAIALLFLPAPRMAALMICLKLSLHLYHSTLTFRGSYKTIYFSINNFISSVEQVPFLPNVAGAVFPLDSASVAELSRPFAPINAYKSKV